MMRSQGAQETKPVVVVAGELNVDIIVSGGDVMPEWNREKMVDGFEVVLGSSSAITGGREVRQRGGGRRLRRLLHGRTAADGR